MRSLWKRWRGLSLEQQLGVGVVPILVAFLSTVTFPMIRDALDGSPEARIESREIVVRNPAYPRGKQQAATVEVALHNVGERTAVLNRALFTIEDFVHLDTCYLQGALDVAKTYGIFLPRRPRLGQTVTSTPLRRQLAPDEAERLAFGFKQREIQERHEDKWVYRLRIGFTHDSSGEAVSAESVVVSLPTGPTEAQLWTPSKEKLPPGFLPRGSVRCMQNNSRELARLLAAPAARTSQLEKLSRRLPQQTATSR